MQRTRKRMKTRNRKNKAGMLPRRISRKFSGDHSRSPRPAQVKNPELFRLNDSPESLSSSSVAALKQLWRNAYSSHPLRETYANDPPERGIDPRFDAEVDAMFKNEYP